VKVLGLDPGSRACGFGLVESRGAALQAVEFGVWRPPAGPLSGRLAFLFERSEEILARLRPEAVSIETVFAGKSFASAVALLQARGILLLAAARAQVATYEYEPLTVKKSITGYGLADKKQVRDMVGSLLSSGQCRIPLDAADALAAAICHCHHAGSAAFDPRSTPC
jgi:crossover junction endodeoxyribonuclease RuvC